jgi:predicted CXXCH cytochrome family protein
MTYQSMQPRYFAVLVILVFVTGQICCKDLPGATPATAAAATSDVGNEDHCFGCHSVQEGMSLVFKDDIHHSKGLSCADCHGGNPKINDMNKSKIPGTGFKPRATREGMPAYCGRCHSDAAFMAKYNPKLPVDQVALYTKSVHGRRLAAGDTESAECADCHSVHDTRAVSDPLSSVSPRLITGTCAKCHQAIADAFRDSPHGREFVFDRRPGCVTCHAGHATEPATPAMLAGPNAVCARCHKPDSDGAKSAAGIAQLLAGLRSAGPDSREALGRARRAVHWFDVAAVKRAINTPAANAATGNGGEARPGSSVNVPAQAPATESGRKAEDDCLQCHGPFDKLTEASANYIAPSGEKTSPHRYVPHDSKKEQDIPECSRCHTAHPLSPLPAKGSIDLSKVGVQYCYDTCHHDKSLESCKNCHP